MLKRDFQAGLARRGGRLISMRLSCIETGKLFKFSEFFIWCKFIFRNSPLSDSPLPVIQTEAAQRGPLVSGQLRCKKNLFFQKNP
jgi:hypothetical protein